MSPRLASRITSKPSDFAWLMIRSRAATPSAPWRSKQADWILVHGATSDTASSTASQNRSMPGKGGPPASSVGR